MSYVASELRRLRRDNATLQRRVAMMRMPGKVVDRDPEKRLVRLELGQDPETGKPIKGPWSRVQSRSAGQAKSFVLPSLGEQMYQESASGIVGADTVACYGCHDDDNPHPAQEPDEDVIFEVGDARLSARNGRVDLKVGGSSVKITPSGFDFAGGKVRHDEKNIGSDHKHRDVEPGGGQSGPPVA